jgi:hypothetical protein
MKQTKSFPKKLLETEHQATTTTLIFFFCCMHAAFKFLETREEILSFHQVQTQDPELGTVN